MVAFIMSAGWLLMETAAAADPLQVALDQAAAAYHAGAPDAAIDHYRKAIEINPNTPAAYGGLGFVYAQQGNYAEAITAYQQAIALDPNRVDA